MTARSLPTGTVTFLRSDVVGSMALARALGGGWDEVNDAHQAVIRNAVDAHGGVVVRTEGDAVFATFAEAGAAVETAVDAQRGLATHATPDGVPIRVRMGLHSGEAHLAGDDYGGFDVNRAARVAAVAHGGQVILSGTTTALVADSLPAGVSLRALGRYALRDVPRPEDLAQLVIDGLPSDFPPPVTAGGTIGNLPDRLTSFVGRDRELRDLERLLAERRLVTITGPGGIGKTSIGMELARSVADRFPDGVWFVELAQIEDPALVRATIARAVGLFDGSGRDAADALVPYLADRTALLVLDNFERLLDAAPDVLAILDASHATRIIVTSRASLRLRGEQEYPIPPLGADGVQLFNERATAVDPGWDGERNRTAVAEICGLLDGLPLGVELAAARVSILPVAAIRDRLTSRLPLPGSGPRDVPDRQRTLDGAVAWSHDLLPADPQRALHDVAVFDGGFDISQAEAVIERRADGMDPLECLVVLAEHSLLMRDIDRLAPDAIRFRLLTTIRGFALSRLEAEGRVAEARRRHAVAFLALVEAAGARMTTRQQPIWLDRLTVDHDNVRSAIRWSIEAGESELALRFVAAMWRFWQQCGLLAEARTLTEAALTMPGAGAPTVHRRAALEAAGGIAYWHGRMDDAERWYEEELVVARAVGDTAGTADALGNLAFFRYRADDVTASRDLLESARQLYASLDDARGVLRVDWTLATLASGISPTEDRLPVFRDLLERFADVNDPWYEAQTMISLAWVLFQQGDLAEASRWYVRSIMTMLDLRDVTGVAIAIPVASLIAIAAERPEDAVELLGAAEQLCILYGVQAPMGLQEILGQEAPHERLEALLGPEVYARRFATGRQMTIDVAAALIVEIYYERWGGMAGR